MALALLSGWRGRQEAVLPAMGGAVISPSERGLGMDTGTAVPFAPAMRWAVFVCRMMGETATRTGDFEPYLKAVVLRRSGLRFGPRPRHEWNSGPVLGVPWAPVVC